MPFVSKENALDSKGKVKKGITVSTDKNGRVRYIGSKQPAQPATNHGTGKKTKATNQPKQTKATKGKKKIEKVIDDIHSNDNDDDDDKLTLKFDV